MVVLRLGELGFSCVDCLWLIWLLIMLVGLLVWISVFAVLGCLCCLDLCGLRVALIWLLALGLFDWIAGLVVVWLFVVLLFCCGV